MATGWLSDLGATCAQDKSNLDAPALALNLPLGIIGLCTL